MSEVQVVLKEKLTSFCTSPEGDVVEIHGPKAYGGLSEKFGPTDLLSASLGSCILTLMGIYSGQLGVDLEEAKIILKKEMAQNPLRISRIEITVYIPNVFDEKITTQLENAARHCPVHQSLHPDIEQVMIFKWGEKLEAIHA